MRTTVLDCPVDVVDMAAAVGALADLVEAGRAGAAGALVVTLNPEFVMRFRRDPGFAAVVRSAALILPDGIGVVKALRRRGYPNAHRVTGVDLLESYVPVAVQRGHRLALIGSRPGVAERAAAELCRRAPGLQVVLASAGDPVPETVNLVAGAGPDVVCAAYGAGRQEQWLAANLALTGAAVGIGVGGTLDFLAGDVRRAPGPVRNLGLEWAWRLLRQPQRIRRQSVLPVFWWLERRQAQRR
ncbi:MAG: WecB/TagA/CpsF family glycosyltransferase [Candidatus Dormibacteria bacterium]